MSKDTTKPKTIFSMKEFTVERTRQLKIEKERNF